MWQGLVGRDQPVTTFFIDVKLNRVLDLTDAATLQALKVNVKDLFKNWRRAKNRTLTQLLGQAVNDLRFFSAIRYPSKAAAALGQPGINFVIFRDCVRHPDSVCILGPSRK